MRTILFAVTLLVATPAFASMCGVKPVVPVGCSDLICLCDDYGQNCQWVCVG